MGVLEELVAAARLRAADLPTADGDRRAGPDFAAAVRGRDRVSVIAEFKRRSPSARDLAPGVDLLGQARSYAEAGAAALSVLTEPTRFAGTTDDLRRVADVVDVPLLMKDFVVDERQVAEAARCGASAVLLIARCLDDATLGGLAEACRGRGLAALVECHDEREVDRALEVPEALVGVNNRDLDTLAVDTGRADALLGRVPADRIAVAESGYLTPEAVRALSGRADAALVGSALMVARDPGAFLREVGR